MAATYEVVLVTPEVATQWLERNVGNRNRRERLVRAYVADMVTGNWHETGDSIKFAADGTLLDGQHRLLAIVASGASIPMLVARGLDRSAQEAMDAGAKRTFADALQLRGEQNYVTLAAVVRRAWAWEKGHYGDVSRTATNAQLFEVLDKYPTIRESARVARETLRAGSVPIPASIIGTCHWLFSCLEDPGGDLEKDIDHFFGRLGDGEGLAAGDPILVLRRTVLEGQRAKSRMTEKVLTAFVIKAWNAFQDGASIALLRYRPGGANPEKFPMPRRGS